MNPSETLYNLVSFSQDHIDAWDRQRQREEDYNKLTKEEKEEYRKNHTSVLDPEFFLGKAYRGTFSDLNLLTKIIEDQNDPYGICECYYTYLCIERIQVNAIDSVDWDLDGEIWYKMNEEDRYVRIEKPDCFKGTCNFT